MSTLAAVIQYFQLHLDWVTAWATVITAGATVGIIYVAWTQLEAVRAIASSDFAHRLSDDLSTSRFRTIRRRFAETSVRFDENGGVPRFMHDKKLLFSARELDDCLLAPLEAIGIYVERGAIDLGIAYEMFGSVVLEIWKYKPVQEYVVWLRKRDDDGWDLYDKLEIFYEKCVSYQDQKRKDTNGAFE